LKRLLFKKFDINKPKNTHAEKIGSKDRNKLLIKTESSKIDRYFFENFNQVQDGYRLTKCQIIKSEFMSESS